MWLCCEWVCSVVVLTCLSFVFGFVLYDWWVGVFGFAGRMRWYSLKCGFYAGTGGLCPMGEALLASFDYADYVGRVSYLCLFLGNKTFIL